MDDRREPPTRVRTRLTRKVAIPVRSRINPIVLMLNPSVVTDTANAMIAPTTTRTIEKAIRPMLVVRFILPSPSWAPRSRVPQVRPGETYPNVLARWLGEPGQPDC